MNCYFQLFLTFAKVGAFTIGGGYAMIPLIQREVVEKKKWINNDEFLDILAISQSAPGILIINISIFIGEKLRGKRGSIAAAIGSALPSFVMILVIAMFFHTFIENDIVLRVFKGIRPVVIALIVVPLISLGKAARLNLYTAMIPVLSVLLIVFMGISPIWILVSAAMLGLFYHYLIKRV